MHSTGTLQHATFFSLFCILPLVNKYSFDTPGGLSEQRSSLTTIKLNTNIHILVYRQEH